MDEKIITLMKYMAIPMQIGPGAMIENQQPAFVYL
jgi:hypothetical protein